MAGLSRDRDLRTLSGGEWARLALAALVLDEPAGLLLDEPTNHGTARAARGRRSPDRTVLAGCALSNAHARESEAWTVEGSPLLGWAGRIWQAPAGRAGHGSPGLAAPLLSESFSAASTVRHFHPFVIAV
ncbi:ATP-binding cassette domain-containing protein [Streptomyces sp. NPDC054855]